MDYAVAAVALASLVSSAVTLWRVSRIRPAQPVVVTQTAPVSVPQVVRLTDTQVRAWVADGYALAESMSIRSAVENKTKPTAWDKRECALAWVASQARAAGVEWTGDLGNHAAKLLEVHHAATNPEKVFKMAVAHAPQNRV